MSRSNKITILDIIKGLLFIASLVLLYYLSMFILVEVVGNTFFYLADLIGNPTIMVIFGALLLAVLAIAIGLGKVTGGTFGSHKSRNLIKDLEENKEIDQEDEKKG